MVKEVVNRTIGQLLKILFKKNLHLWEEVILHIEFAYNRAKHSTTSFSPFEVVYGFNHLTRFDLVSLPVDHITSMDGKQKTGFVKSIHDKVHEAIEAKNKKLVATRNVERKRVVFE